MQGFYTFCCVNTERFNKKCKNLTANKSLPFESLANSLVRDATARYFRWLRSESPTRTVKTTRTELSGKSKVIDVTHLFDKLQCHLSCGCCRIENSTVYSHSQAIIGGKRFNPGESLRSFTKPIARSTLLSSDGEAAGTLRGPGGTLHAPCGR